MITKLLPNIVLASLLAVGTLAAQATQPKEKDEIVYVTASGAKYHRERCRTLTRSKTKRPVKKTDAEEKGYTACKVCY